MPRRQPTPPPWSPQEDDTLREISRIGLDSYFWKLALPQRTFGDICNRRLEIKPTYARMI